MTIEQLKKLADKYNMEPEDIEELASSIGDQITPEEKAELELKVSELEQTNAEVTAQLEKVTNDFKAKIIEVATNETPKTEEATEDKDPIEELEKASYEDIITKEEKE